ncbi:DUF402 domain-containing protein [Tumebacillus sp. ITR2]|uniref:DUF402 domain-containing protein n=1 Tax=Tumebacillus amylolyticus TaxID=2801339 RepID=A0ABS1JAU2_9BACL|nr:DUF402 domain-containing protein [Tumebacillus amylolyticus]MBL0387154.1 DUF402 domain-containing protein [Tumebacillus amylolyticus]
MREVEADGFRGRVSLLHMDRVAEPFIWKYNCGSPLKLMASGYQWMDHLPFDGHYVLNTVFNEDGQIVQWYIDIMKQHGLTDDGVPWYDDLYLDLVVLPTGEVFLLDEDELDEALRDGVITQEDYDLAWRETRRLQAEIAAGTFPNPKWAEHRHLLLGTQ